MELLKIPLLKLTNTFYSGLFLRLYFFLEALTFFSELAINFVNSWEKILEVDNSFVFRPYLAS